MKSNKIVQILIAVVTTVTIYNHSAYGHHNVTGGDPYPKGPHAEMTPGQLCDKPDSRRYHEGIAYCSRDVKSELKWQVIDRYDHELGFHVREIGREQFKIDHYIPLCMGGSNNPENLWPQHHSVYEITDPLEALSCEKMAAGVLVQKDAVELIKQAKNHLEEVPQIMEKLQAM